MNPEFPAPSRLARKDRQTESRLLGQIHCSALKIAELRYVAARLRAMRTRLRDLRDMVERSAGERPSG